MEFGRTFACVTCLYAVLICVCVGYWSDIRPSSVLSGINVFKYEPIRARVKFGTGQILKWDVSGTQRNTSQVFNDTHATWINDTIPQVINGTANITATISNSTMLRITPEQQFNNPVWYIHSTGAGRLGNQMLQYAALFCAATGDRRRHGFIKSGYHMRLTHTFPNLSLPILNITMTNVSSSDCWSLERLGPNEWFRHLPTGNVTIRGYFTSHIYFTYVESKLRKEYTFPKHIREHIVSYLKSMTPKAWMNTPFVRVGIHVRRGDRTNKAAIRQGEVMHPTTYYHHAMDYFLKRLEKVQFFVASDDIIWCKRHLNRTNVVFSTHDYVTDLAMLSACDHMIISTGSYGWWAGYLCKGTTLYYDVFPANGTSRAQQYRNGRWIPPPRSRYNNWIPLTV